VGVLNARYLMSRILQLLPVPTGDAVLALIPALQAALSGSGPALLPVPADDDAETARLATSLDAGMALAGWEDDPHDPTALVVATSGSTGTPKGALLPAAALNASAEATRVRLCMGRGGSGRAQWLLALPATHIAGLQVLLRAMAAGGEPTVLDTGTSFAADRFTHAVGKMPAGPRFTSLVPTQLSRVLGDPETAAALATFDAVLVGGAATPQSLRDDADREGVALVTTYGMSETCGGCVYDGLPLAGVAISTDEASGRVSISGPVVARGYRHRPTHPSFPRGDGRYRTFLTDDLAVMHDGRWSVVGRVDDVIITGGIKIDPAVVEAVLARVTGVGGVIVTGIPDPVWGQLLIAVVAPDATGPPAPAELRRAAAEALGPAAAPKQVLLVESIPEHGIGKPDRSAVRDLAVREFGERGGDA
jgi:O-succinylbenzoic acid--CoA ligase